MGDLANAFYPLWGTLRKELKKPPPKAQLFEEKLEKLLAAPNREWDEIHTFERFRVSSLWKSFTELPIGIANRVPSWVDGPFIVRGALRRLFGPPLFIKPLTDEEALIADFALDSLAMEFPNPKDLMAKRKAKKEAEKTAAAAAAAATVNVHQGNEPTPFPVLESSPEPPPQPSSPSTKKRKVVEKAKRKILAKRNKRSKVMTPELDVERPKVEVALPPRLELLRDQQASVEIMNQLLSEADAETLGQGPLLGHMDDLLWDGLKQRTRIRELEAINKNLEERDRRRGEMLLDVERKFADVKTSADGLTATLKEIMHEAKEGTSMMEV
ncbi:hypothetical protein TIFTF001_047150 [Ficus carica]|uniref:Uncharacterized protein n=1 Tax=Ficus carica TaxID=3494 RepID=A0AA88CL14_FICCA|nr:hypothetical protein TIFTF001_047150 [Ficus carica]